MLPRRSSSYFFLFLTLSCSAGSGADSSDQENEGETGGTTSTGGGNEATTGGTSSGGTVATGGASTGGTLGSTGGVTATGGSSTGGSTGETCTPGGTGFSANGDHTIDLSTCVYYQRFASQGEHQATLSYDEAIAACEALSLAGFDDWRLPSVAELNAIVDTNSHPSADPTYFPGTLGSMYWTSMTTGDKITGLDFNNNGAQNDNLGTGAQAFRCVRAPL